MKMANLLDIKLIYINNTDCTPTAEVFFQIKLKNVIFFIGECRSQYDISVLIDTHSTNNVENQVIQEVIYE
jgi:hypothetical protein